MALIDDVTTQLATLTSSVQKAIALLNTIPGLLANAGTDPAKLQALSDQIVKDTSDINAALTADTPTPPTP